MSNSEIYRSQGVAYRATQVTGGIHETTKTPGSASTVKSTGQYSGLDLRWDLQISTAKWIYIYYINVMC